MSNMALRDSLTERELMLVNSEFEKRRKSKVIIFLLWFFLGAFGAHRFYTGQTGYAVCMLLFSWATLGIWPFIDGLVLLISKADEMNEAIERNVIDDIKPAS